MQNLHKGLQFTNFIDTKYTIYIFNSLLYLKFQSTLKITSKIFILSVTKNK